MTLASDDPQMAALRQELHMIHNHYGSLLALAYRQVNDMANWGVPTPTREAMWAEIDAVVSAFHASLAAQRPLASVGPQGLPFEASSTNDAQA